MIDKDTLKRTARERMQGQKPSVFFVAIIYLVIMTILFSLSAALLGYTKAAEAMIRLASVTQTPTDAQLASLFPPIQPTGALLTGALLCCALLLETGFAAYCLKVSRQEEATTAVLFGSFRLFLKVFSLTVLQILLIGLGTLFFFLPGAVLFYRYRQALYILLDHPEYNPIQCLHLSGALMRGQKVSLFLLDLSFLGWYVADFIVRLFVLFRIVSVWLSPYAGITRAGFYNALLTMQETAPEIQ